MNRRVSTLRVGGWILLSVALHTVCTACNSASDADSDRNPFHSKWEAECGLDAVFEGLAAGHTHGRI